MPKGRVESFSDGVITFAITLSRLICTVAWISHHEFMHDLEYVNPRLLWLNSLYLMWIAFPLPNRATWKSSGPPVAVAVYGSVCSANFIANPRRLPELGRTIGRGSTDSENHIRAFYPQAYAFANSPRRSNLARRRVLPWPVP